MTEVGVFEAKAHLSELLARVAQGEQFLITRHGHPMARLVPFEAVPSQTREGTITAAREFRAGRTVSLKEITDWIGEGRR